MKKMEKWVESNKFGNRHITFEVTEQYLSKISQPTYRRHR